MATPAIGQRRAWNPGVSAGVDREHPLAKGLIRHWDLVTLHDRCNSGDRWRQNRNNADTASYPTPWGPGFQRGADGGGTSLFSSTVALPIGETSLTIVASYVGFGSNPNLEGIPGGSGAALLRTRSAADGPALYYSSTASQFRFIADGTGLAVGAQSSTARTLGQWYMIGGTYDRAANSFRVYVDGRLEGTDNLTGPAGTFSGTWGSEIAHAQSPATNFCSDKRMGFIAIWTRALSPGEMAQVYANPYQMFRS